MIYDRFRGCRHLPPFYTQKPATPWLESWLSITHPPSAKAYRWVNSEVRVQLSLDDASSILLTNSSEVHRSLCFATSHLRTLAIRINDRLRKEITFIMDDAGASIQKQGAMLRKSRSGCRECRRRKVKVSIHRHAV